MKNRNHLIVFTTVGTRRDARAIADILLQKRLAACVQIVGPVASSYRWRGKIARSKEWLCIIKTKRSRYAALEREIKRTHPYELPEIVAARIAAGSREYLRWMEEET